MAGRKPPAGPLGCLEIGYQHFVLPMDHAQKALALLAAALVCEEHYEDGETVYRQDPDRRATRMSVKLVRPEQLQDAQLRIGMEPLKLPAPRRPPR
ncbi:hypothetical protein [Pseudacidovorax intermedius]|nr:hypothetical protein [Pseudacidovorax intermedius]